ncbi:TetR/AcrR family transcriptional regulator [Ruegeria sp. HKCCA6837]|uniref:TetR/AcrR family transcriptional regulator n=1 Tax=Ruegeria sp. HKCCA6837 TaxID=2682989 RepID=UPI001487F51F|nr:TetR/AcrR family transcriptional regulator [Ruegeria sp. HKCCA6837]
MSDTKTALLDFAEHAARARGFDGFSYADLAEAVGIRKASIHYHFPTKANLSAALMDRYHTVLEGECQKIEDKYETGSERLQALVQLYRDALNDGKTLCLCVSLISSRESLSEEVIEKIRAFRAMMVQRIQSIFELGQTDKTISGVTNPASEARAALALLEGAHLTARAEENIKTFDEAIGILKSRC